MKHTITSRDNIDNHISIVHVLLKPDNDRERNAIKNVEKMNADDSERELVENYLNFSLGLGNYSIVESMNHSNSTFVLKIFIN